MIGRQLGPYTIVAPLGSGGMGEVYRARDSKLGRDVAIKILPSQFTADPERRARFAREARLLATLNHPHIGAIYGLEETDGVTALVLELVDGPTLADRLARGPLPIPEALAIARQIAEALDAAHQKGIVHRDLKPANIVVQGAGNGASSDGASEGARLRPGEDDSRGTTHRLRASPDHHRPRYRRGQDSRNAGLHEPGAGARAGGRQADRHLGFRLCGVRDADVAPGVRRRDDERSVGRDPRSRAGLDCPAGGDTHRHATATHALPREGSGSPPARHRRCAAWTLKRRMRNRWKERCLPADSGPSRLQPPFWLGWHLAGSLLAWSRGPFRQNPV